MSGFMAENFTAKDVIVAAIGHGLGPTSSYIVFPHFFPIHLFIL